MQKNEKITICDFFFVFFNNVNLIKQMKPNNKDPDIFFSFL